MVGPDPLHGVAAVLHAAPEVTAAYHHAYLDPQVHAALDHVAHLADHVEVQPSGRVPRQGLAADLQQYPLILWLLQWNHSHSFS